MLGFASSPCALSYVLLIFVNLRFCSGYAQRYPCNCTEKIYEITTRRNFCGKELRLFDGGVSCYLATTYECPKSGPGGAKKIRYLKMEEYCAINCHGTQNPNVCEIVITRSQKVEKDSLDSLYPKGDLPKSHVPKVSA
jgi:hypothetical protein